MNLATKLDEIHTRIKCNKWFRYFAIFIRVALAAGFIPSGLTKIVDERFTSLSSKHPMGNYLEALYNTGYYYPFIGYVQVTAAILLLIPRTATLGAVIYFPLILNICILSLAVGFEGSLVTSPLMVLANLYLLCWDYNKLKFILPFSKASLKVYIPTQTIQNSKFPTAFFLGVFATVVLTVLRLQPFTPNKPETHLKIVLMTAKTLITLENVLTFATAFTLKANHLTNVRRNLER